jgi:hypothetical protein
MAKERQSVRVLTTENWRDSRRCRRSAGLYTSCWIEKRRDGRYRTYFYTARNDWDSRRRRSLTRIGTRAGSISSSAVCPPARRWRRRMTRRLTRPPSMRPIYIRGFS